jgi:hypothetical protein
LVLCFVVEDGLLVLAYNTLNFETWYEFKTRFFPNNARWRYFLFLITITINPETFMPVTGFIEGYHGED